MSYEADALDPDSHLGWSVILLGKAQVVEDPAAVARYSRLVRPWVGPQMDYVIRIHPKNITGYEVVDGESEC